MSPNTEPALGLIDRIRRAETVEEVHALQKEGLEHQVCSPAIKRRRVKAASHRIWELSTPEGRASLQHAKAQAELTSDKPV